MVTDETIPKITHTLSCPQSRDAIASKKKQCVSYLPLTALYETGLMCNQTAKTCAPRPEPCPELPKVAGRDEHLSMLSAMLLGLSMITWMNFSFLS